jgi:hypothetical protein
MTTQRAHFPFPTASQRRLLFETWQQTGTVTLACRTAHVGRRTFYYWKPRVDAAGYAGLEAFHSAAPKQPARTDAMIAQQVIALRRDHPTWGKQRIAHELAKANGWVPLLSATTVKRILVAAGLWTFRLATRKKSAAPPAAPRKNPANP